MSDLAGVALRWAKEDARYRPRQVRPPLRTTPWLAVLSTAVEEVLVRPGWITASNFTLLCKWPTIVGERVAPNLAAVDLDERTGVLTLAPASPAWAAEGRGLADTLVRALNQRLGTRPITSIRLLPPPHAPRPRQLMERPCPPLPRRPVPKRNAGPAEPEVEAARTRQASMAREPTTGLLQETPRTATAALHARALARARADRAQRERDQQREHAG
ncbi:DUF721 domain-containing protein [Streptomyces sp. JJ66]|uniref:DUF721 domain-containing protein n=1 Tax=Streptomyces sp. JJ66 TaxID=2803843 RepID=UPI001C580A48|nr:DUF721 domain-containing protein [Streptomyces sp. JJ66]